MGQEDGYNKLMALVRGAVEGGVARPAFISPVDIDLWVLIENPPHFCLLSLVGCLKEFLLHSPILNHDGSSKHDEGKRIDKSEWKKRGLND